MNFVLLKDDSHPFWHSPDLSPLYKLLLCFDAHTLDTNRLDAHNQAKMSDKAAPT